MAKITAIVSQKGDPDRVNIHLDGEYAFGLAKIIAAWLKVGQELGEEKIASLVRVISEAGRIPVQRDTHYNVVRRFDRRIAAA